MSESESEHSLILENEYNSAFEKQHYEGEKGHLLMQLQKSYKGDKRFTLSNEF
jgi:hypothetical protein